MSDDRDLERLLGTVLGSATPADAPDGLFDSIVSTTGRVRPRPRWPTSMKEPPMRLHSRVVAGSPVLRTFVSFGVVLALLLAVAGAVAAGASLLPSTPLPAPFGLARTGLLAYTRAGDIYVADPDGTNGRPVTSGPERDFSPWFSHDGTKLVFGRGMEPEVTLMIANPDGSELREVMPPGDWNIEFMPSDTQMVGTRGVDGGTVLSIIDVASGEVRDLDLGGLEPQWWQMPRPPDGDEVIFTGSMDGDPSTKGIYAVHPDGSGLRSVGEVSTTETQAGEASTWRISFQDPVISPDGATIAYWSWEPRDGTGPSDAYMHLRDLTTGEELPIRFDPLGAENPLGDDGGLLIRFSPDGEHVVFEGCSTSVSQLCYGTLDGSTPSVAIGPPFTYQDRTGFDFSPDGQQVILALQSGTRIIDVVTGEVERPDLVNGDASVPIWQRLAP